MTLSTVVITGANRGIGLNLARFFLESGSWKVIAGCRSPNDADALNELSDHYKDRIAIYSLDVVDQNSVSSFAASVGSSKVDLMINNAGIMGGDHQTALDMDFGRWEETLKVNTLAPLRMVQALYPNLKQSDHPRIVTISSQMGASVHNGIGAIAYRSSKAAVNKVMQGVSLELENEGFTVVLYHPGWVQTDMGGSGADITPSESAEGLYNSIISLAHSDNGRFMKWTGEDHAW